MTERILRRPAVEKMVGLSRSTIYAMMAAGEFPAPIKLGRRAVGWRESSILQFLDERPHGQAFIKTGIGRPLADRNSVEG